MKNVITLTKTLTLAMLLVAFTAASASFGGSDDSTCRTKCCKNKSKEFRQAMNELKAAMKEIETEFRTVTATLQTKQVRVVRFARPMMAFATAGANSQFSVKEDGQLDYETMDRQMDSVQEEMSRLDTEDKASAQKINFKALDQEMDQAQAELSKMDAGLKSEELKSKKSAEEKTGIKS